MKDNDKKAGEEDVDVSEKSMPSLEHKSEQPEQQVETDTRSKELINKDN